MAARSRPARSARSSAAGVSLQEQWRSLDGLLDTMARRTRSYAPDAEEEDVPASAAAGDAAAQGQIAALRGERDQLRQLLAGAHAELRTAQAEIRDLQARLGGAAAGAAVPRSALAEWWSRWLQRLR